MHPRQRLLRHPRRGVRGARRARALSGHLCRRLLQPAPVHRGGPLRRERGHGQPPQLAPAALPDLPRRRGPRPLALPRPPVSDGAPADAGPAARHPDPLVGLRGRGRTAADRGAVPPGAHGRAASGRAAHLFRVRRVDGRGRGGVRDRRGGPQCRRRALPRSGGPASDGLGDRRRAAGHGVAELPHPRLGHPSRAGRTDPGPGRPQRGGPAAADRPAGVPHPGTAARPRLPRGRRQNGRAVHLPRPGDREPAAHGRGRGRPRPALPAAARRPPPRLGEPVAAGQAGGPRRVGPDPAAAPVPCAPDSLAAHLRAGCRGAGPGPARRGVPRARLLGRAVRPAVPEPAPPAGLPGPARLPLPAAARGLPRGAGGGPDRGDVPLAERGRRPRGDPAAPSQPALGALAARSLPAPAPRRLGGRLQRVAVRTGQWRHRVPALQGCGDAAGDRPFLGLGRGLGRCPRPLSHPRGGRSRRVPRRLSGRRRTGGGRQRLHQCHGGLGADARSICAARCPSPISGSSSNSSSSPRRSPSAGRTSRTGSMCPTTAG